MSNANDDRYAEWTTIAKAEMVLKQLQDLAKSSRPDLMRDTRAETWTQLRDLCQGRIDSIQHRRDIKPASKRTSRAGKDTQAPLLEENGQPELKPGGAK